MTTTPELTRDIGLSCKGCGHSWTTYTLSSAVELFEDIDAAMEAAVGEKVTIVSRIVRDKAVKEVGPSTGAIVQPVKIAQLP